MMPLSIIFMLIVAVLGDRLCLCFIFIFALYYSTFKHKNGETMIKRPNLFKYATKELSQDAFICWLLEWADKGYIKETNDDKLLHDCAIQLLRKFFKNSPFSDTEIQTLRIIQQFEKIDILLIVNEEIVIIIEDKTGTNEHSGQLESYKNKILKSHDNKLPERFKTIEDRNNYLLCIYFKTGDQLNFKAVKNAGYKPFLRKDLLSILDQYQKVNNNIFVDFYTNLKSKEYSFSSFGTQKLSDWNSYSWRGFISALSQELKLSESSDKFDFSGHIGISGFYWNWNNDSQTLIDGNIFYLRINFGKNPKLIFKLESNDKNKKVENTTIKNLQQKITIFSDEKVQVKLSTITKKSPIRATIAEVAINDFRFSNGDQSIAMDRTVVFIKKVQDVHKNILKDYQSSI
jgi:hypothetical protein